MRDRREIILMISFSYLASANIPLLLFFTIERWYWSSKQSRAVVRLCLLDELQVICVGEGRTIFS